MSIYLSMDFRFPKLVHNVKSTFMFAKQNRWHVFLGASNFFLKFNSTPYREENLFVLIYLVAIAFNTLRRLHAAINDDLTIILVLWHRSEYVKPSIPLVGGHWPALIFFRTLAKCAQQAHYKPTYVHIFLIYSFKNDHLECVSQMGLCEMRKVHLKKNDEEE